MTANNEQIVMTPKGRKGQSTILLVERKPALKVDSDGKRVHVAGGDHTGIVINKDAIQDNGEIFPPQLSLEFRVFLVNATSGNHSQEARTLRFWFKPDLLESEQPALAQEFFRELVSPQEFPRDYVGFIKKIMKLLQHKYTSIKAIEVELRQLEETVAPPARPLSADENTLIVPLTAAKVLELIESAYPNPITVHDIARDNGWEESAVAECLQSLQDRGLVKAMEHNAFTRVQHQDTQIQIVKQMPTMASNQQPTIAIVTANYCEKLAVDAMLENKETFVRYTTVGESNVYTLGNIGAHRIVCTKLPTVGHTREALTASGNTTTRLLGTFQKVDYVFLVGVGGGVPHYTDFNRHVRLGDVVISSTSPGGDKPYVYAYCAPDPADSKTYCPNNLILQEIAKNLKCQADKEGIAPWERYMEEGLLHLQDRAEHDFTRPSVDTDKLYMAIGDRDVIEVAHPNPPEANVKRSVRYPRVHLGVVGCGREVVRSDTVRIRSAVDHHAIAFDLDMDAVIESVIGNCRDSFVCIRGIADYKDGSRGKEWQPNASLAAASVMKAIVCALEPPSYL